MPAWPDLDPAAVATWLWAFIAALAGLLATRMGWNRAQPPNATGPASQALPPGTVEVAGALIDTKHVALLIDALGLNSAALTNKKLALDRNTEALDAHRQNLEANSAAAKVIAEQPSGWRGRCAICATRRRICATRCSAGAGSGSPSRGCIAGCTTRAHSCGCPLSESAHGL